MRRTSRAASSPRTVRWYDDKLHDFLRWVKDNGHGGTLSDFTANRVREYILYLQEKEIKWERNPFSGPRPGKLSGATIQGYVRTYKAFASWLIDEGYTDQNLLQRYRMPKARKSVPEWLRQDEIERLLGKFDRKTAVGARDYAVIVTFLDTGLRCSELCGLTLEGADLDVGELKVIGKVTGSARCPSGCGR